jgi:hypothetical protein
MFAAMAESEQTGAALLAERIEDNAAEVAALASGARYAQGYFYGSPGALPGVLPTPKLPLRILQHQEERATPFTIVAEGGSTTAAPVSMNGVRSLIGDFVALVDAAANPAFVGVLAADAREFDPAAQVYARAMADKSALHLVVGRHASVYDDWYTHAVDLPWGHSFLNEICFVALSPSLATVVAFRPFELGGPDAPAWEVAISQNPTTCRRVVRRLLEEADRVDGGALAGQAR